MYQNLSELEYLAYQFYITHYDHDDDDCSIRKVPNGVFQILAKHHQSLTESDIAIHSFHEINRFSKTFPLLKKLIIHVYPEKCELGKWSFKKFASSLSEFKKLQDTLMPQLETLNIQFVIHQNDMLDALGENEFLVPMLLSFQINAYPTFVDGWLWNWFTPKVVILADDRSTFNRIIIQNSKQNGGQVEYIIFRSYSVLSEKTNSFFNQVIANLPNLKGIVFETFDECFLLEVSG